MNGLLLRRRVAKIHKYTPMDYIQDGLISLYDGEWNAGIGIHDPQATVWKDLKGGWGDLSYGYQGITINSNHYDTTSIEGNIAYNGTGVFLCSNVPVNIANGGTMTMVLNPAQPRWFGNRPYTTFFESWNSGNMLLARIGNARNAPGIPQGWSGKPACFNYGWTSGRAMTYTIFINGKEYVDDKTATGALGNNTPSFCFFKSAIYCIRVYNRKLSLDELRANLEIDKKRFGLSF